MNTSPVIAMLCLSALAYLPAVEDLRFIYGRGEQEVRLGGTLLDDDDGWKNSTIYQVSLYGSEGVRYTAMSFSVGRAEGSLADQNLTYRDYVIEASSGFMFGGGGGLLIDVGVIGGGGMAELEMDGGGDDREWFFRYGAQATASFDLGGLAIGVGARWTASEIDFDSGLGKLKQEGFSYLAFIAWRL